MYSAVLMLAMATSPEAPNCGFHAASCYGCYGGCYGSYGGYAGYYGYSSFYPGSYGYSSFYPGSYGYSSFYPGSYGYSSSYPGSYGYSSSYPGSYGYPPSYSGPVRYYTEAAPASQPYVSGSLAPLSASIPARAPAVVEVTLPENAKLFVDSRPVAARGHVRRLVSPPVEAGKDFTYLITASIMRDQKEVKVEKRVTVRAGQTTPVTFEFPHDLAVK